MDADRVQDERKDYSLLLEDLLTNTDPATRRHAAEELALSDSYSSIAGLAAALKDSNKGVREAAQRSLLSLNSEQVARSVVDYIAETDIVTRNSASDILIRLGKKSVQAILPLLYDSDQDVRKFAVDILGCIGDDSSVERMLPLLQDPDVNVVVSVVEALGNIQAHAAIKSLCDTYEVMADTKAVVIEALGKIGGGEAADFILQKFCEVVLEPITDPLLIYTILEALAQVGGKKALTILKQHLSTFTGKLQHLILHSCIRMHERCNDCEANWAAYKIDLLNTLTDDSSAVRLSAIKALKTIDDDDVTEAFLSITGQEEEKPGYLLQTLSQRNRLMQIVVEGIKGEKFKLNKSIYEILQQYILGLTFKTLHLEFIKNESHYVPQLSVLLGGQWQDADQESRPLIIDLLFKLDGDHAIGFLAGITEYPDPWLRMQVIELLGPVADRRAMEFLLRFLSDEDEMVRQIAYSTLEAKGYTGELSAIPVMGV